MNDRVLFHAEKEPALQKKTTQLKVACKLDFTN